MTITELDAEFLTLYDRVSHSSAPSLDELERSQLLTKAQENVVKRKYNKFGNKYGEGFDITEKRRDDLDKLIKYSTPSPSSSQVGAHTNGVIYDLPQDYWLTIEETASINKNDCVTGLPIEASIKPITHDFYSINIKNPFRNPYYNDYDSEIWRIRTLVSSNLSRHELITDGTFSVNTYKLRYLKYPTPIVVAILPSGQSVNGVSSPTSCELSEGTQREILDEAVRIATLVTNPAELQLRSAENQLNE